MGIDQHKQKFDKLLANGNYPDALRLLFSILDCEPSLSNYNFAASRLKRFPQTRDIQAGRTTTWRQA